MTASTEPAPELTFKTVGPEDLVRSARQTGFVALITEADGEGIFAPVRRVTLAAGEKVASGSAADFRAVLEDASVAKYGEDLKYQSNLLSHAGIVLGGRLLDIALMHYLIELRCSWYWQPARKIRHLNCPFPLLP